MQCPFKSILWMTALLAYAGPVAVARGGETCMAERGVAPAGGVCLPARASPSQRYAAEELTNHLFKTVGVALPVVRDRAAAKIVLVTADDASLGEDGFTLDERDGRLFIRGSSVRGCLYGAYEFLERFAGCRWYSSWCERLPQLARVTVPAGFHLRETPAFDLREPFWYDVITNRAFGARLRCNGYNCSEDVVPDPVPAKFGGDSFRFGGGLPNCHTFAVLLPPRVHFREHPEYYALTGGKRQTTQPCLTHPDVLRIVTSNVLARIRRDPTARFYGVSQNDRKGFCECPACKAIDDAEESHAGTVLRFVNAVAAEVEREFPRAVIETLAYMYARKPPKHVRPRKNVMICLCNLECDFARPLNESPFRHNKAFCEDFTGWSRIARRLYVWDYATDFINYPYAYANFPALQGNIRFFRDRGVKMYFVQGGYEAYHAGFAELKAYLQAKFLWNPDADANALLQDFTEGFYGPAGGLIRDYLRELTDLQLAWSANPGQPLLAYVRATKPPYPDDFYARWDPRWDAAEKQVRDHPTWAYNLRYARFSHDYAKFERLREKTDDDAAFRRNTAAMALLRKLLKDVAEARGPVMLRETKRLNDRKMKDWQSLLDPH